MPWSGPSFPPHSTKSVKCVRALVLNECVDVRALVLRYATVDIAPQSELFFDYGCERGMHGTPNMSPCVCA